MRDDAVVDLAGEQPQREADDAAGMGAHPLDREIGLAGIGRAQGSPGRCVSRTCRLMWHARAKAQAAKRLSIKLILTLFRHSGAQGVRTLARGMRVPARSVGGSDARSTAPVRASACRAPRRFTLDRRPRPRSLLEQGLVARARDAERPGAWAALLAPGLRAASRRARRSSRRRRVASNCRPSASRRWPMAPGPACGWRETSLVEPIAAGARAADDRSLFAKLGRDGLDAQLLARSGASYADAIQAASLVAAQRRAGRAGHQRRDHARPQDRRRAAADRAGRARAPASTCACWSSAASPASTLTKLPIAVDRTPLRIRGRAGDGLYLALRAAGVSPQSAGEYLKALATQHRRRQRDRARRPLRPGRRQPPRRDRRKPGRALALCRDRPGRRRATCNSLKWTVGRQDRLVRRQRAPAARRRARCRGRCAADHLDLRPARPPDPALRADAQGHRFRRRWGTPIVAAADGQVVRAGWAGGYGQQVRLAHGGGMSTSYSHMSRITAAPGSLVRQGQLIGYVGSTGLSTGPHLHYEVCRRRGGQPDVASASPMRPAVDPAMTAGDQGAAEGADECRQEGGGLTAPSVTSSAPSPPPASWRRAATSRGRRGP